eukprot:scaffold2462_cov402-Prasinococcus_capsulatus_cf.AAC.3
MMPSLTRILSHLLHIVGAGRIPAHNTGFRVQISGIPPNSDWRDLKDFLREGGEITYANVNSDGTGYVNHRVA